MLLFFLGMTVGIMSHVAANKREVDCLNELLKQNRPSLGLAVAINLPVTEKTPSPFFVELIWKPFERS